MPIAPSIAAHSATPAPAETTFAVDGQTAESWNRIVAGFTDANVYQTWAYGAVRWGADSLSHLVVRHEQRIVAAAQLRIARLPITGGIAYLRWGPMCHSSGSDLLPDVIGQMLAALREEYVERRGLVLQVIPSAFAGTDRGAMFAAGFARAGLNPAPSLGTHRTVIVDLLSDSDTLRRRLDKKWRNQLTGSQKNQLEVEMSDGARAYGEFLSLYDGMWERKRFSTSVDPAEFARIQDQLPAGGKLLTFLARAAGEAVAAVVCSIHGDSAVYLLGATNERARNLKAAYFLHWEVMMYLKARGIRYYDLGGIDPATNQGGYHFKSGFGGSDVVQLPAHTAFRGPLAGGVFQAAMWLRSTRNRVAALTAKARTS